MNIPQLQIQTTRAVLGLQITKPTQQLEQPKATMALQQPAATLEMSTTKPRLSLDTTEVRADLDLKSPLRRSAENAQYGNQSVQQGIGRRASEGQMLMQIESGGDALANLAEQVTNTTPAPLGIRFVSDRTKIQTDIQSGSLNINVTPQKVVNNVQVNKPIHHYQQGKVTGEIEQWNSIQIDVQY